MSDARYPPHAHAPRAHYGENIHNQVYAVSGLVSGQSQRPPPPTPYGHLHVAHEGQGQPSHPLSYPGGAFPVPQRSMTPSLANHPQLGYSQNASRHRTSSIGAMQAPSPGHYAHMQHPSLPPSNGHHRSQSQFHAPDASAAAHERYATSQPYLQSPDYLHRSITPAPSSSEDYYYGHPPGAQDSPRHDLKRHRDTHSGERPFLCNGGCGKTFTRKDALKRHQLVKGCGRAED
ncbi:hypothetical protein DFH11DRAFT_1781165 [Phellopilus nigrolimitatus]|nr:hypothetical protein DFH11DRAFT_1781165 [Phellopilus nigrolimitatus]